MRAEAHPFPRRSEQEITSKASTAPAGLVSKHIFFMASADLSEGLSFKVSLHMSRRRVPT